MKRLKGGGTTTTTNNVLECISRVFESDTCMGVQTQALLARGKADPKALKRATLAKRRFLRWSSTSANARGELVEQYRLLRPGIPVSRTSLEQREQQLTEKHLFIFRHVDPSVQRNTALPRYEGVLRLSDQGTYVRAQKGQLEHIYADRRDRARCDEILIDSTPYWVDRHGRDEKKNSNKKKRKT